MKNLPIILLLLLLSISSLNQADEKFLIVGSEQNYPPFALGLTDETADGFTVELWRAVAAEVHLNSTVRVLPFYEVLQEFKAGKIDVLINLAQSDERKKFAVQKGNSDLLAKINEGLALTKASGVYDKLYEKWFGVYEEKNLLPLLMKYLSPVVGIFLLILIVIFYRRTVERKKIIKALKESEQKLAPSNADLLQFTNVAAHHLQEPTRRMVSFVQRLKHALTNLPNCNNDDVMIVLQFIEQSAIRQRALVGDIQLYLAATQPRATIESVPVIDILTKVLKHFAPLIQETHTHIEWGELPAVLIDRPRLYDIFNILIENALHYRRLDCILSIRIYGEVKGERVRYYIEDNGVGIPAEYRERVFLVFERLQINDDQESTGVGLAIVRRILESCGGSVSLKETTGDGTTVVFDLPAGI